MNTYAIKNEDHYACREVKRQRDELLETLKEVHALLSAVKAHNAESNVVLAHAAAASAIDKIAGE